jgi:hypothetical protein
VLKKPICSWPLLRIYLQYIPNKGPVCLRYFEEVSYEGERKSIGENFRISLRQFSGTRATKVSENGIIVHRERKNSRSRSSGGSGARQPIGWKSFAPGSISREAI